MTKQKKIWLSSPHMGGEEQYFIKEAFNSNWIAPLGPNVNGFEEDLENYLNSSSKVAALVSGTAALHLGLKLLGVTTNDIVLCQSLTFAASANPILYLGATPIFIDSERKSWNICPEQLEEAITYCIDIEKQKPKAIIAVHLYGMPYDVDAIQSISKKYGIPILEDSAESLGSSYKGQKCGTFGDQAILSFNGNKMITTSGGGALVSQNEASKRKAIFWATQAKDDAPHYQHSEIGYNYRMSNIIAGIGRGQMKVLDAHVSSRRSNYLFYQNQLNEFEEIKFLEEPEGYYSNRWLTCIETPSFDCREKIRFTLSKANIETRPLWKPMHCQPLFRKNKAFVNGVSEDLFNRSLCLPSGSNLSEEDLTRITTLIKSTLK